jgi:hypothetical protein
MAGRIPVHRRVGDLLRIGPGKADRGICTSCRKMPPRALPPATAQLDDLRAYPPRRPQLHHAPASGDLNRRSGVSSRLRESRHRAITAIGSVQYAATSRPSGACERPRCLGSPLMTALAAVRAPGHQPHHDKDGQRYQPDDDKRLERGDDPACGRNGKPYGEDRAEDSPDDPAHIPIMRPAHLADGCHAGRECRRSLSPARQPHPAVASGQGGYLATADDHGRGYHGA